MCVGSDSLEALLAKVDQALYRAKSQGKGHVVVGGELMQVSYLADCHYEADKIAQWYFDEWGHLVSGTTVDDVRDSVYRKARIRVSHLSAFHPSRRRCAENIAEIDASLLGFHLTTCSALSAL